MTTRDQPVQPRPSSPAPRPPSLRDQFLDVIDRDEAERRFSAATRGFVFVVIDPDLIGEGADFRARVREIVDESLSLRPMAGTDAAALPGTKVPSVRTPSTSRRSILTPRAFSRTASSMNTAGQKYCPIRQRSCRCKAPMSLPFSSGTRMTVIFFCSINASAAVAALIWMWRWRIRCFLGRLGINPGRPGCGRSGDEADARR